MSITFNLPSKRRIFYSQNKKDYFNIFSFSQDKKGDIYCGWPNYLETKWMNVSENENNSVVLVSDTPENSTKLSLHGSGVVKFKQNDPSFDVHRIKGNHLINFEKNQIGARHLFTGFMREPNDMLLSSPFKNRESDFPILAHHSSPFVIMFFAVPQQSVPLNIQFVPSFNLDYFESNFSERIGSGFFSLAYHDVIFFAYTTKFMTKWPKHNLVFYDDGFKVPIFIAQDIQFETKHSSFNIALIEPTYELSDNNFRLILPFPEIDLSNRTV